MYQLENLTLIGRGGAKSRPIRVKELLWKERGFYSYFLGKQQPIHMTKCNLVVLGWPMILDNDIRGKNSVLIRDSDKI